MSARRSPMKVSVPESVGCFSPRRMRSNFFFGSGILAWLVYDAINRGSIGMGDVEVREICIL
jgi:hypothetical protein